MQCRNRALVYKPVLVFTAFLSRDAIARSSFQEKRFFHQAFHPLRLFSKSDMILTNIKQEKKAIHVLFAESYRCHQIM